MFEEGGGTGRRLCFRDATGSKGPVLTRWRSLAEGGGHEPQASQTRIQLNPVPVQDFLDRSNLTQKDMACLVGISEAYFSQLMNRERSSSARVRNRFQQIMGTDDFDGLFMVEPVGE